MIRPEDPTPQRGNEVSSSFPHYESALTVPLAQGEFIINAGHYDRIVKNVGQEWQQLGLAREVMINGLVCLVVDTKALVDWVDTALHESTLEKVRLYLLVLYSLLISPEEKPHLTQRQQRFMPETEKAPVPQSSLAQRLRQFLQPDAIEQRTQSVERTLWALEQEVRQFPNITNNLVGALDKLLIATQANLGLVEEEGFSSLVSNRENFAKKLDTISNSFVEELRVFAIRLEYYATRLELAHQLVEGLMEKLDPEVWAKHSGIMEERLTLQEAIAIVKGRLPDMEKFRIFNENSLTALRHLHQAVAMMESPEITQEEETEITTRLYEAEKLFMDAQELKISSASNDR